MFDIFDAIVVGSGASGVWAAHGLEDKRTLMLDIGVRSTLEYSSGASLAAMREDPSRYKNILLGDEFQSLNNIFRPYLSPKVKAPGLRNLVNRWETSNFDYLYSEAVGGLANNWGTGVYPFSQSDFECFPISLEEILPFYKEISKEIGISGCNDDLVQFYGDNIDLQRPMRLPEVLVGLKERYNIKREKLHSAGFVLGHGRMAIATEDGTVKAYDGANLEYFLTGNPSVYNPRRTLSKLKERPNFLYKDKVKILSFFENENGLVEVTALDLSSQKKTLYKCKSLLLGAGAIQTTKIVVNSLELSDMKFPLLDNCSFLIPLLDLRLLGTPYDRGQNIGGILNGIFKPRNDDYLHFSMYSLGQVLVSDIVIKLPVPRDLQIAFGNLMLNSLAVAQVFYSDSKNRGNTIYFDRNGDPHFSYLNTPFSSKLEAEMIKCFRRLGMLAFGFQVERMSPGNGIHYAGMLPMGNSSALGACDRNCKVNGTKNVYAIDASSFPRLPSKNHTFTIMANALRIGRFVNSL